MGVVANLLSDETLGPEVIRHRDCMTWVVDAARPCSGQDSSPQNNQPLRKQALRVLRSLSLDSGACRQMYADKKGCREVIFVGALGDQGGGMAMGKTRQMIEVGVREQSLGVICNMAKSLARDLWKSRRVRQALVSGSKPDQLVVIREMALQVPREFSRRALYSARDVV